MKKIFKKILMTFQGFIGVIAFLGLLIALFLLVFQIANFNNFLPPDNFLRKFFEFFQGGSIYE